MKEKYIPRHSKKFAEQAERKTGSNTSRIRKIANKAISTALIGGSLANGAVIAQDAYETNDPFGSYRETIGLALDKGPAPVSPETRQKIVHEMSAVRSSNIPRTSEYYDTNSVIDYRIAEAERLGLHVLDSREHEKALMDATSVDHALSILNDYSSNLGVSIEVPTEFDRLHRAYADNQTLFTSHDFSPEVLHEFRIFGMDMLAGMSSLPREAYELAEVNTIRLVDHLTVDDEDLNNYHILGVANPKVDTITLQAHFSTSDDPSVPSEIIRHEIAHHISDNLPFSLVGAGRDVNFTKLNDPEVPYGKKFDSDESARHFGYASAYAARNTLEDNAETFEALFDITSPFVEAEGSPYDGFSKRLQNKMVESLGRIEERVPNLGVFLARTAPFASMSSYYIPEGVNGTGG